MEKCKRLFAILLSVMMITTYMPALAFAAAEDSSESKAGNAVAEETQDSAESAESGGESTAGESAANEEEPVKEDGAGPDAAAEGGKSDDDSAESSDVSEESGSGDVSADAETGDEPEAGSGEEEPADTRVVEEWSFSKVNGDDFQLEEGVFGYEDEGPDENTFFRYYINIQEESYKIFEDGDTMTVKYEDEAEPLTYTYYGWDEENHLEQVFARQTEDGWDTIAYNEITLESVQDEEWTQESTDCKFRLLYKDVEYMFPFVIVENPIKSISFSRNGTGADEDHPLELLEEVSGQWGESENPDNIWYWYYITYEEGDVLTINGTDYVGRQNPNNEDREIIFVDPDDEEKPYVSECDLEIYTSSEENPWTAGNTYTGTIRYNGVNTPVYLKIVANIVESVAFERPGLEDGEAVSIRYIRPGEEGFYSFSFEAGDLLTVQYKIGSDEYTVTYTFVDEERDGEAVYRFETEDNGYPEDIPLNLSEDDYFWTSLYNEEGNEPETWALGETHECVLSYMNRTCVIPVKLVDLVQPVSAEWTYKGDQEKVRGLIGTSYIYGDDFYNDENELVITLEDGSTVTYICKSFETADGGTYTGYFPDGDTSGREAADFNTMHTVVVNDSGEIDENAVFAEGDSQFFLVVTYNDVNVTAGPYDAVGIEDQSGEHEHEWGEPEYTWGENEFANQVTAKRVCSICGEEENETIDGSVETDPETGDETITAEFSNEAFETQIKTRKHVHEWLYPTYEWADDYSTCTATRICAYNDSHVDTETVASTMEDAEDGQNVIYTAEFTNEAFETQSIMAGEPAEHSWDEGVITKEATEDEEGVKTYTCTICGKTKTESIPKKDHQHSLTKTDKTDATCTEAGNNAYWTCSGCGKYFSDPNGKNEIAEGDWVIPALGHNYDDWEGYDQDRHWRVCMNDGSHVEYANHNWDEGVVTKEPTEEEEGVKKYTCTVCGETMTEPIPRKDHQHSLTKTDKTDATCTEAGSNAYWTCSSCGKYFSDADGKNEIAEGDWVIPALGHNYGDWEEYDSDQHWRVCSIDSSHTEYADHEWDNGEVTLVPTTRRYGIMTYTCKDCRATRTESLDMINQSVAGYGLVALPDESEIREIKAGESIDVTDLGDGQVHTFKFVSDEEGLNISTGLDFSSIDYQYGTNCEFEVFTEHQKLSIYRVYGNTLNEFNDLPAGNIYIQFDFNKADFKEKDIPADTRVTLHVDLKVYSMGDIPADVEELHLDDVKTISGVQAEEVYTYKIVPEETKEYYFGASSSDKKDKLEMICFRPGFRQDTVIDEVCIGASNISLTGGKTYYLQIRRNSAEGAADKADLTVKYCNYKKLPLDSTDPDCEILAQDTDVTVTAEEEDKVNNFRFIPEHDGTYIFTSSGQLDTYGAVCLEDELLKEDDDSGEVRNFKVTFKATAGTVYYLQSKVIVGSGEYTVKITHTHSLTDHPMVKATCTEEGMSEYWTCDICGRIFADSAGKNETTTGDLRIEKDPDAHIWDEGVITKEPTETEFGTKIYTCTLCGTTMEVPVAYGGMELYGKCGDDVTWTIDPNGTLIISGNGDMDSHPSADEMPWYSVRELVKAIEVRDGVTSVASCAFSGCVNAKTADISKSVKTIGASAFVSCSSLESVSIPFTGASRSSTGTMALFGYIFGSTKYDGSTYTRQYDGESKWHVYYLPSGLTTVSVSSDIYEFAFNECNVITNVILRPGVTEIGQRAFQDCDGLTSITLPESIKTIDDAFEECNNIEEVKAASIESWLGITFHTVKGHPVYGDKAKLYINGELLTDLVIPEGTVSIGDRQFTGCNSITSIRIPASLKKIGSHAFDGCEKITEVYAPDLESWLGIAFSEYGGSNPLNGNLYLNGQLAEEIVIPEGVSKIGDYAFCGCRSVKSITIPDSVTCIGEWAFCKTGITEITIPDSVTTIEFGAFSYTDIKNVVVPDSVTSMDGCAFDNCESLKSIKLPKGIEEISSYMFRDCISLETIDIPEGVTRIRERAFNNCKNLTVVNIPNTVTYIGNDAFCDCTALERMTIPESVKTFGEGALAFRSDNAVIYGVKGSAAETEAGKYGLRFEEIVEGPHEHVGRDPVKENEVAPTCGQEGSYDSVVYCKHCGEEISRETIKVPATGIHTWGDAVYGLSSDKAKVTASHKCTVCGTEEKETVAVTAEVVKPGCETAGSRTYKSAAFKNAAFAVWTSEAESITATGHKWNEPAYRWSADNTKVTAARTCANDPSHSETETVAAEIFNTVAATAEAEGVNTWKSAGFSNSAFKVQTKDEVIPKVVTVEEGEKYAKKTLETADDEIAKAKASSGDALDKANALNEQSDQAAVEDAVKTAADAVDNAQKAIEAAQAALEAAQAYYNAAKEAYDKASEASTADVSDVRVSALNFAAAVMSVADAETETDAAKVLADATEKLAAAKYNKAAANNTLAKSEKAYAKAAAVKTAQAITKAENIAASTDATEEAKAEAAEAAKAAASEAVEHARAAEDAAADTESMVAAAKAYVEETSVDLGEGKDVAELVSETENIADEAAEARVEAERTQLTADEIALIASARAAAENAAKLADEAEAAVAAAQNAEAEYEKAVDSAKKLADKAKSTGATADVNKAVTASKTAESRKDAAEKAITAANKAAEAANAAAEDAEAKIAAAEDLEDLSAARDKLAEAASKNTANGTDLSAVESDKAGNDTVYTKAKSTSDAAKKAETARQGKTDKKIPQVKGIKLTSKKTTVTVKWTKLTAAQLKKSKATKYEIWVCPNKNFAKSTTKVGTVTKKTATWTCKKLKKNTTYYVKVRAIRMSGKTKYTGKWSAVKKIKTKKK